MPQNDLSAFLVECEFFEVERVICKLSPGRSSFPTAEQDLISCHLHAGQGLLRRDFLAGCSPRIGAGWKQKLLDLDIPVSGQFLLEVWFPT